MKKCKFFFCVEFKNWTCLTSMKWNFKEKQNPDRAFLKNEFYRLRGNWRRVLLKFSQKMLRNYQLINKLRGKNEMSLKNSIQFEKFSSQIRTFSFRTKFHQRSGCVAQKHTFFVCGYNHGDTLQFTSFSTKPTKQGKKAAQVRVKNQIEVEGKSTLLIYFKKCFFSHL